MSSAVTDSVWSAADVSPAEVEEAIRRLVVERHQENPGYVPARALNLVCVVDKAWSGEIANRLRRVGRYHASRTVVCAVEPARRTLDAVASVAAQTDPAPGEVGLLRETIVMSVGETHLAALDSVVGPLVVPDLATIVWAPHGHAEAVDALLSLAQSVLFDTDASPEVHEGLDRARELRDRAYVVDLAWLRTTPWRERVASAFDPPKARPQLAAIADVSIRHHPDSIGSALLLLGWLSSRLGWRPSPLVGQARGHCGGASGPRGEVRLTLEPTSQEAPGLAGVTIQTAGGGELALDRGAGGLLARRRAASGAEHEWTVLGASRGEAGILGEGIRQALLRDATYEPALDTARLLAA